MDKANKFLIVAVITAFSLTGCTKNSNDDEKNLKTGKTDSAVQNNTKTSSDISGNYVSEEYEKRNNGSDWVAVIIKNISDEEISISVRSRADIKKPTCLFDAKAKKVSSNIYESVADGKKVLYTLKDTVISISTEKPEDEKVLEFYCSGGASVAGNYYKIKGALDENQIDKTIFNKVLNLQNTGFNVTTKPKGDKIELEIYPFGLSEVNDALTQTIEGSVTDAEIEDLNSDGFPEVMVYTQSGENKAGNVFGCSVNNGKSMSYFYFPPVSENSKISNGYNGYDEFSVVETSLSQRFPVFENGKRTGKIRQIDYTLVNGENGRIFKVKNITEY